jgi:hypothetical protein
VSRCGGRRRQVDFDPRVDGVAVETVGTSDGIHAHTKALSEGVESIARLDSIPRDPTEGRTTRKGTWSGTDVQSRRQVNLLTGIDCQRAQTVGVHQRQRRHTSSQSQAIECFSLLHFVGNPTSWR